MVGSMRIMHVLLFIILVASTFTSSLAKAPTIRPAPDDGSLYLTPLLDNNYIKTARLLSEVKLPNVGSQLRSQAGYITVDKYLGNHMFFWHFPSHQNPEAPLFMWLNGGPTVSSMMGLFWGHGPLAVKKDESKASYVLRNHTWVGPYSVVYVDNPVGGGYSYTENEDEGYRVTQEGYTQDLYNFVLQFFKLFPEYKNREFYIGGQSYAGKYVPALAHRIHEQRHNECREVPLTGIILGGPYFDPPTESVAFSDFLYSVGVVSHSDMIKHKAQVQSMHTTFMQGGFVNVTFWELFQKLFIPDRVVVALDNYVTGEYSGFSQVDSIMTSLEVRQAVHVGRNRSYFAANSKLQSRYGPDTLVSTKPQMAVLMDNYKVLVYNGDYDVVVSSVMIEAALMTTNWTLQAQYNKTHRLVWKSCGRLKGFFSQTERFCRVVVHGAGHQTPHDVPGTSLEMVTDFLKHGCIKQEVESTERCKDVADTSNLKGCGVQCALCFQNVWFLVVSSWFLCIGRL